MIEFAVVVAIVLIGVLGHRIYHRHKKNIQATIGIASIAAGIFSLLFLLFTWKGPSK